MRTPAGSRCLRCPQGGAVRGAAAPLEFRTRADEPVPATATTGEES